MDSLKLKNQKVNRSVEYLYRLILYLKKIKGTFIEYS